MAGFQGDSNNNNECVDEHRPARDDCPVDGNLLGTSTWIFLHTLAARYPVTPSTEEQKEIKQFFNIFAKFYPCSYCAEDLQNE